MWIAPWAPQSFRWNKRRWRWELRAAEGRVSEVSAGLLITLGQGMRLDDAERQSNQWLDIE